MRLIILMAAQSETSASQAEINQQLQFISESKKWIGASKRFLLCQSTHYVSGQRY
ncbi:hypothetical protein L0152_33035 [bacterium]|nr:hypothetical protein [bacterium]